jgi:hypothetical protein
MVEGEEYRLYVLLYNFEISGMRKHIVVTDTRNVLIRNPRKVLDRYDNRDSRSRCMDVLKPGTYVCNGYTDGNWDIIPKGIETYPMVEVVKLIPKAEYERVVQEYEQHRKEVLGHQEIREYDSRLSLMSGQLEELRRQLNELGHQYSQLSEERAEKVEQLSGTLEDRLQGLL